MKHSVYAVKRYGLTLFLILPIVFWIEHVISVFSTGYVPEETAGRQGQVALRPPCCETRPGGIMYSFCGRVSVNDSMIQKLSCGKSVCYYVECVRWPSNIVPSDNWKHNNEITVNEATVQYIQPFCMGEYYVLFHQGVLHNQQSSTLWVLW